MFVDKMGDEEFVVKCVEPPEEDDENNPGSGVQTAYDVSVWSMECRHSCKDTIRGGYYCVFQS